MLKIPNTMIVAPSPTTWKLTLLDRPSITEKWIAWGKTTYILNKSEPRVRGGASGTAPLPPAP